MMNRFILTVIAAILCFPTISNAEEKKHTITVQEAWTYPMPPSAKNSAVFLVIRNTMPMPDRVIGAYAEEIAERAELHTHIMDGDMMMMREVEAFDIDGGGEVILEPTGHHIMLMGLKKPLNHGDTFRLTLDFEKSDDVITTVHVGQDTTHMDHDHSDDSHAHDDHGSHDHKDHHHVNKHNHDSHAGHDH